MCSRVRCTLKDPFFLLSPPQITFALFGENFFSRRGLGHGGRAIPIAARRGVRVRWRNARRADSPLSAMAHGGGVKSLRSQKSNLLQLHDETWMRRAGGRAGSAAGAPAKHRRGCRSMARLRLSDHGQSCWWSCEQETPSFLTKALHRGAGGTRARGPRWRRMPAGQAPRRRRCCTCAPG